MAGEQTANEGVIVKRTGRRCALPLVDAFGEAKGSLLVDVASVAVAELGK